MTIELRINGNLIFVATARNVTEAREVLVSEYEYVCTGHEIGQDAVVPPRHFTVRHCRTSGAAELARKILAAYERKG